jgi:hypothetical protein
MGLQNQDAQEYYVKSVSRAAHSTEFTTEYAEPKSTIDDRRRLSLTLPIGFRWSERGWFDISVIGQVWLALLVGARQAGRHSHRVLEPSPPLERKTPDYESTLAIIGPIVFPDVAGKVAEPAHTPDDGLSALRPCQSVTRL